MRNKRGGVNNPTPPLVGANERQGVMGLDFRMSTGESEINGTHPCWSYSGFASFRREIGLLVGIDLRAMQGYGGECPWANSCDPIVPLLDHSDCDGDLAADVCRTIAPRLRVLAERLRHHHDVRMGAALADMMDECAKTGA